MQKKKIIQSSRKYIKHNKLASHTLTHGTAMALHKNERNGLRGVGSTNEYFFFSCFMIMTHEIPYRQTHKLTATRPYYGDHKRFSPHILCVCVCARHGFVLFAIFILNHPPVLCARLVHLPLDSVVWALLLLCRERLNLCAAFSRSGSGFRLVRTRFDKCRFIFVCLHKNGRASGGEHVEF